MPTARQTPVGLKPEDGFSTKITFDVDPDISFWEKTVKPPGLDGGDAIDTTTMFNLEWRTMAPRSLKTATDITARVTYDPLVLDQIAALINVPCVVTITFFDGSHWDIIAFLRIFNPSELSEGSQPEADITITPTNTDPDDGSEVAPNYITPTGTS